jgi:hypothetical protein
MQVAIIKPGTKVPAEPPEKGVDYSAIHTTAFPHPANEENRNALT